MIYDITQRVSELRKYYDITLEQRIAEISEKSDVPRERFIKINPADFIEKNKYQRIDGYSYQSIKSWIIANKTGDDVFLISPLDEIEETAAQCAYKTQSNIRRTIRASKCEVIPCPKDLALDFFIRNHRQSAPLVRDSAVCFSLAYGNEIVAVMLYDVSNGAVRGESKDYELVRLSVSKGTKIHGGASKLQAACEETLFQMGIRKIYSYSNATINSGAVYRRLGFEELQINQGQTFVILHNNKLERLINLYPESTDRALAEHGWIKSHIGGNKKWIKEIRGKNE